MGIKLKHRILEAVHDLIPNAGGFSGRHFCGGWGQMTTKSLDRCLILNSGGAWEDYGNENKLKQVQNQRLELNSQRCVARN